MKYMFASDIHGSAYYCRKMLEAYEKEEAERLVLLGDLLYHGPRNDLPKDYAPKQVISMLNEMKNQIYAVRGNCEAEVDQMVLEFPVLADYCIFAIDDLTFFATHGHVYNQDHLPPLMAGDILLYQANLVPVGVDQTQHLEICRDIATRFNGLYGNVFTIPEGYYPKLGARVMSLQDPKRKMSKSDPDDCFISMLDGADVVRRKLRRAVTDSDSEIRFDAENKPGVSNLLAMLCALTGEPMDKTVESFAGKGYGDLKSTVADAIIATLEPIQADYNRYMGDKAYLETVYRQGAERAGRLAERTLSKAMKKIGFIAK